MDTIQLSLQFQSLFVKFQSEERKSVVDEIENILKQADKQLFLLFSKIFCQFIPSRSISFKTYVKLFSEVPSLSNPEFKDIFLTFLRSQLLEPNQPEICEFFSYLVELKYIEIDQALDIILYLFKSPEKLDNIHFVQFLYCVFRIRSLLSPNPKYQKIIAEFQLRSDNIEIGVNLDDNSEIYVYLFGQLKNPEANPIKYILDDEEEKISSFPDVLDASLYVSPNILTFSPPICSVCAFFGSLKCLKALISNGRANSLLEEDSEGRTIADFAAAGGNLSVIQFLKEKRVNFEGAKKYAIEFYHEEAFNLICSYSPRLDDSLCHSAVKVNNISMLKYLISKNVSFEGRDDYNWTPLHIAASHNSLESVQILISQNGINVNIADLDGETPLHCAARDGYIEIMSSLLNHPKVNPMVEDNEKATPLHWAACHGQAEAARLLVSKQTLVRVNSKDAFDRTPLILASASNSPNVTRVLLSCEGIDVNAADKRQTTPLIAAAESKSLECVKLLANSNNGIDFNRRNVDGTTAIDIAAFGDAIEIVQFLLNIKEVDANDLNNQRAKEQLPKRIAQLITDHFAAK